MNKGVIRSRKSKNDRQNYDENDKQRSTKHYTEN